LRLFSFGGYGLALAALALVVFGAIECPQYFEKGKGCTVQKIARTEKEEFCFWNFGRAHFGLGKWTKKYITPSKQ